MGLGEKGEEEGRSGTEGMRPREFGGGGGGGEG